MWFQELVAPDEVAFDSGMYLLRKAAAEAIRLRPATSPPTPEPKPEPVTTPTAGPGREPGSAPSTATRTIRLSGTVPPEVWNRLGTKILPRLRSGSELKIGLDFSVTVPGDAVKGLAADLRQILQELGLADTLKVD
jgi:hypothetical protein